MASAFWSISYKALREYENDTSKSGKEKRCALCAMVVYPGRTLPFHYLSSSKFSFNFIKVRDEYF